MISKWQVNISLNQILKQFTNIELINQTKKLKMKTPIESYSLRTNGTHFKNIESLHVEFEVV